MWVSASVCACDDVTEYWHLWCVASSTTIQCEKNSKPNNGSLWALWGIRRMEVKKTMYTTFNIIFIPFSSHFGSLLFLTYLLLHSRSKLKGIILKMFNVRHEKQNIEHWRRWEEKPIEMKENLSNNLRYDGCELVIMVHMLDESLLNSISSSSNSNINSSFDIAYPRLWEFQSYK